MTVFIYHTKIFNLLLKVMFVTIDIYSKNLTSLNRFIQFFNETKLFQKVDLQVYTVQSQTLKKKKFFTVLKSPHVNKNAQDQFEYSIYKKQIKCFVSQFQLFLILLKKIKFALFSDINFRINIISNPIFYTSKLQNQVNIDNYSLIDEELDLVKYLKIIEIYGEVLLKSKSLDSSVG